MNNYHKKRKRNAMIRGNRPKCVKKKSYDTSIDAWEGAEYYYILHGDISNVYHCCVCDKFHLTKQTTLGDMTHIPEQFRELFKTVEQGVGDIPFIIRLRKILI